MFTHAHLPADSAAAEYVRWLCEALEGPVDPAPPLHHGESRSDRPAVTVLVILVLWLSSASSALFAHARAREFVK